MIDNETGEVMDSGFSIITHSDGDLFGSLSAANTARLIYLCTFSHYSGQLVHSKYMPLYRGDLQEVLKLSKTATYDFLNEVCPEFIQIKEDESLYLNGDFLKRDRLESGGFIPCQKFYDRGVRELYRRVGSRKHKHLGYVFLLLRYVNIEYNMLCHNPHEKELACVNYMTAGEFCKEIGYSPNNVGRLIQIYERITFWTEGKEEYFCTFNYRGNDKINATVWINPNILYNGTKLDEVKLYFSILFAA